VKQPTLLHTNSAMPAITAVVRVGYALTSTNLIPMSMIQGTPWKSISMANGRDEQRHWRGVPFQYVSEWDEAFAENHQEIDFSGRCPVCGHTTLHQYYQVLKRVDKVILGNRFVAEGALWRWCSSCLSYDHLSALVPAWWSSRLVVDESRLTVEPEAIEQALRQRKDAHCSDVS